MAAHSATGMRRPGRQLAEVVPAHGDVVAGRKIEVIRRDDTGLAPDVARRVATELIVQDHVDVLLGLLLTPQDEFEYSGGGIRFQDGSVEPGTKE